MAIGGATLSHQSGPARRPGAEQVKHDKRKRQVLDMRWTRDMPGRFRIYTIVGAISPYGIRLCVAGYTTVESLV